MTLNFTKNIIVVIKITSISTPFLFPPLGIGSRLSSLDIALLGKCQDVFSIPLDDFVHSTSSLHHISEMT